VGPLLPKLFSLLGSKTEGKLASLSDCKIHYSIHGRGRPLLLLHGWGANIFCWRFLTPLLSQKFRVYELDLPGFGRSTKVTHLQYGLDDQCRRISEFMELMQIKEAYFVGSSLGGAISLWMATLYPRKVLGVVAISPAAHRKVLPASLHHFSGLTRFMPVLLRNSIARYSLHQTVTKKELITVEAVHGYLEPFNETDSTVTLIKASEALRDQRLPEGLKGLSVPVKVLYGEKDNVIKRKLVDEILTFLPSATNFKTHATAGHHIQEDEPEWVYHEIQTFFDS